MSARIAIFEDDKDLAVHLKELLESMDYQVTVFLTLKKVPWEDIDVIFGDYRNNLVSFKDLIKISRENDIPLIAISGGDMDYSPSLSKPFLIEEMEALIMKVLQQKNMDEDEGFFKTLKKAL